MAMVPRELAQRAARRNQERMRSIGRYTPMQSGSRRWYLRLVLVVVLFYTALFVTRQDSFRQNEIAVGSANSAMWGSKQLELVHQASPGQPTVGASSLGPAGSLFDPIEVEPQCDKSRRRRVIDTTFVNNELSSLELRLNEMWNVVDVFYIAESSVPFKPGAPPKPTYLTDHWKDFERFHSKIVLNVLSENTSRSVEGAKVDTEDWRPNFKVQEKQREVMWQDMKRLVDPSGDDLIIKADLDEIPRPHVIEELACASPDEDKLKTPVCLETKDSFYYYNYKVRRKGSLYSCTSLPSDLTIFSLRITSAT